MILPIEELLYFVTLLNPFLLEKVMHSNQEHEKRPIRTSFQIKVNVSGTNYKVYTYYNSIDVCLEGSHENLCHALVSGGEPSINYKNQDHKEKMPTVFKLAYEDVKGTEVIPAEDKETLAAIVDFYSGKNLTRRLN